MTLQSPQMPQISSIYDATEKVGEYTVNQIYDGDSRILAAGLPDACIDLIFADPEYEKMDDYEWLARTACRVLKPHAPALIWCGIGYLPETLDALRRGGLTYRWELGVFLNGGTAHAKIGFCKQLRLLWMDTSGTSRPKVKLLDCRQHSVNGQPTWVNPRLHGWVKVPNQVAYWMNGFTDPGDLVFDPFHGWGTVGLVGKRLRRNFIAFELDPERARISRQRIAEMEIPLPIAHPHQQSFWNDEEGVGDGGTSL